MADSLSYKDLENIIEELKISEKRLEENSLQKERVIQSNENLYDQIINNLDKVVIVIQGDAIKYSNQAALDLLKTDTENIENIKFSEIIHEDYKGELIKSISQIVSGNQINTIVESKINDQLGDSVSVRIILKKLLLTKNQVSVLVQINSIEDIKSKEKQVNDLRKSVDFLEQHVEEGILFLRKPEGEDQTLFACSIEDLNNAASKIIQKEKNVVIGKIIGDFLEPSDDIKIPIETESDFDDDFEIYIKNLNKYFRFNIYHISKSQIACKIIDITDFYLTKIQLNDNLQRDELFAEILNIFNSEQSYENKYTQVLERIAYNFGTKRIIIFYNDDQKKSILNYQHSIKGTSLLSNNIVLNFNKVPSWNKMLMERKMILGFSEQYLPDDILTFFDEIKIQKAYVFPIFVEEELFGSVLFQNMGQNAWDNTEINYLKMVTGLIANLTSRQNYEDKLLKAKEKAENADRLKSSFLANMSHDIRIPMTSIIGFSDLLADPDLTIGEREEFIELISNSGKDLLTLVDNIVDIAKIETGQLKINKDKVSIINLFKDLYSDFNKDTKLINQDDLELILDLPDKFHTIPFDTDVFRFKQVLNNLLDNAIKFTDKGSIHFGVSNIWPETIEFYVQDTGIGIAEETQHTIFESFSKVDRSYTKEYNGTGLGLAICKSLVELLGGEIRIVSYPGKGSTFYFTHLLPKEADSVIKAKSKLGKGAIYNWEDKIILIAEDVEQNYKYLEYILNQTKAKLVWAKDGQEALNYFKERNECDCVLMDIRMPNMNGIDASKAILKLRDVPIIIQTAYTLGDEKQLAINVGCVDYVSKPINAEKLLQIIEKYINYSITLK